MWKAARYHKGIALSLAEIQQQEESVYYVLYYYPNCTLYFVCCAVFESV